jgi:hypothetical protein
VNNADAITTPMETFVRSCVEKYIGNITTSDSDREDTASVNDADPNTILFIENFVRSYVEEHTGNIPRIPNSDIELVNQQLDQAKQLNEKYKRTIDTLGRYKYILCRTQQQKDEYFANFFTIPKERLDIFYNKKLGKLSFRDVYGNWSFRYVYGGHLKSGGKLDMIKVACVENPKPIEPLGNLHEIYSEIKVWKELTHPNIVEFYGACLKPNDTVIFVMERMKTTLYGYMKYHPNPERKLAMSILCQATRPIKYLSDEGIVNRYFKTTNYFVNEINEIQENNNYDIILKFVAFGLTRKENLFEIDDNTKGDVYNLGCILTDLLRWGGLESEVSILEKLKEMTNYDPVKRPDISEILQLLESF